MTPRRFATVLAIVALLVSVTPVAAAGSIPYAAWAQREITPLGGSPAVRIGSDGFARVVYRTADELRFARETAAGWVRARIVQGATYGRPDIELDGTGKAHVAFGGPSLGLWYATDRSGAWKAYRLTTDQGDGGWDLAVDPDGEVDIVFHRKTKTQAGYGKPIALMRATNRRGYWQTFALTKPPAGGADESPSIGRDATGALHIAFDRSYSTTTGLRYMTNASGSWVTRTLTTTASDRDPRLVVAPNGAISVGFVGGPTATGRFALVSNRSGTWTTRRDLVPVNVPSAVLQVAVDASGEVHAAWCSFAAIVAIEKAGAWTAQGPGVACDRAGIAVGPDDRLRFVGGFDDPVIFGPLQLLEAVAMWGRRTLGPGGPASNPSVAGDRDAHAHLAWREGQIRYATDRSGSWVTQALAGTIADEWPVVATSASGKAFILVFERDPGSLQIMGLRLLTNATGSWVRSKISTAVEWPSGLALGPDGSPWVLAESDLGLRLYHRVGSGWTTVALPAWSATSRNGGIAVDTAGKVHLAMSQDSTGAGLRYATNATGSWSSKLFAEATGFIPTGITLDAAGKVHLAYTVDDRIRYATNASGAWVVVTAGPRIGEYIFGATLDIDAQGEPWVAVKKNPGMTVVHRSGTSWSAENLPFGNSNGVAFGAANGGPVVARAPDTIAPLELLER